MLLKYFGLSFLALLVLSLAGCGSSSGGNNTTGGGGGGSTPTAVTISFSGGTPTAVAAKIGSGDFAVQTLSSGKLNLSIPNGTTDFAVAYLCTGSSFPTYEEVLEASTADGTSFSLLCVSPSASDKTGTLSTNVDATGVPGATSVNIAAENGNFLVVAGAVLNGSFSYSAPAGTDRVEVLAYNSGVEGLTLAAARNFTNQQVPGSLNGGNQVVLGSADSATSQQVTYTNVPTGYIAPSTAAYLVMGGVGGVSLSSAASQYSVPPSSAFVSGDYYKLYGSTNNNSNANEYMFVEKTTTTAGPVSFSFPAPWTYAGPTAAALPTFDFTYTGFTGTTGVFDQASLSWSGANGYNNYQVIATANYLNGATSIGFPDLSNLTGFAPSITSGTKVLWTASISQSSSGIEQLSSSGTLTTVQNTGSYTVP